jgi:UDP-glucuronate decarboxylase
MKTILVTGGAGFIGSHLCDRLIAWGNEVICVDNCFSGSRSNIHHLLKHPRFEFIRHDITLPLYVQVDEIYNLACPASPLWYQVDPVQTTKTAVIGAINMLGLAKRVGARILQASTSEVYGDPLEHPQGEEYWGNVNPIGPRSCYDEGKRCAETLFTDYHREYGVDIRIARIFNTYGPRMAVDDGRVVSNFIMQALRGQDFIIFGDGQQTRSFCYVDDMVDGLITLMDSGDHYPVNLGNPDERHIYALAKIIKDMINSKLNIVFKDLPEDDPKRRCPDITLAQKLGWNPKVLLREGLKRTIDYFRCSERVGSEKDNLGSSTSESRGQVGGSGRVQCKPVSQVV